MDDPNQITQHKQIDDVKKRISKLESQSFGSDPAVNPITFQNFKYQANLLAVIGRSSGAQGTVINANTITTVQFPTNNFSSGITWDSTNFQFKCATPGYYLIAPSIVVTNFTASDHIDLYIYKNGSQGSPAHWRLPSVAATTLSYSDVLQLATGDTIQIRVRDQDNTVGLTSDSFVTITKQ